MASTVLFQPSNVLEFDANQLESQMTDLGSMPRTHILNLLHKDITLSKAKPLSCSPIRCQKSKGAHADQRGDRRKATANAATRRYRRYTREERVLRNTHCNIRGSSCSNSHHACRVYGRNIAGLLRRGDNRGNNGCEDGPSRSRKSLQLLEAVSWSTPRLWSTLHLFVEHRKMSDGDCLRLPGCAKHVLQRSTACSLDISLHVGIS